MTTENLPQIQNNNFPTQVDLQSVSMIARTAHASSMYSGIGGEAKIMMILLAAKELGVGPCQALNGGIWSIQGKIEISARLMNGLIRRAGHSIKVIRSDDECCTLRGTRTDGDSFECSFTIEDATKAGLSGSNVWKKYPGDMLYNRCMSRLGRRLFSDVIGQCYIEGEIKEAKEVEKLEQAEYQEIKHNPETLQSFTMDKPSLPSLKEENKHSTPQNDTKIDHFKDDKALTQEPKISFDDLTQLMKHYAKTDDQFKENLEKYMKEKYNVMEFEDLPAKCFHAFMNSIIRNIEMNSMERA